VKAGQGLSKMSKPTALHSECTAKGSDWFNISDNAKKLYKGRGNSRIAVVITTKMQTESNVKFISNRKAMVEKVKTHTQVPKMGFHESARVKRNHDGTQLGQIEAEMV
jgi:hypothetical protein